MLVNTIEHNLILLLYTIDFSHRQYPDLQIKVLPHEIQTVFQLKLVLLSVNHRLSSLLLLQPCCYSLLESQQQYLLKKIRTVHQVT